MNSRLLCTPSKLIPYHAEVMIANESGKPYKYGKTTKTTKISNLSDKICFPYSPRHSSGMQQLEGTTFISEILRGPRMLYMEQLMHTCG